MDAVSILTVHQAKGLEWPIVFLPCLTDGRFPSGRAGREREWKLSEQVFDLDKRSRYEGVIRGKKIILCGTYTSPGFRLFISL